MNRYCYIDEWMDGWIDKGRQVDMWIDIDRTIDRLMDGLVFIYRNGNYSLRCHNSLGHMAPLGLTGERYISHCATRFGKDSNPGRQNRRPKTSRLNHYAIQPPISMDCFFLFFPTETHSLFLLLHLR